MHHKRMIGPFSRLIGVVIAGGGLLVPAPASAQGITAAGQPAQLDIRVAGERSIRVTLKPLTFKEDFPVNPAVATRTYPAPALSLREIRVRWRKRSAR